MVTECLGKGPDPAWNRLHTEGFKPGKSWIQSLYEIDFRPARNLLQSADSAELEF
jgi:hypothetical protein